MPITPLLRIASLSLALLALPTGAHAGPLQDHPGRWLGDLTLPDGHTLRLGAELYLRADGSPWASLASPDQGVVDIPIKAIREEGVDAIVLDAGNASLKLAWDKDHFNGEWRQGPAPLLFTLRQVAGFPEKKRPQTPSAPLPYREEALAIKSTDGVTLGATLTLPPGRARPNAVVLVHGSGPATRHASLFGHRAFDVLADHLARQGVAVLRYDKRGVGRSSGDFEQHTLAQLRDDLHAVAQALRARRTFGRIGFIGLSEGSAVSAGTQAPHPQDADFIVSLGGVGVPGFELLLLQDRIVARDHGASPAELDRIMTYVRRYYQTVQSTPDGAPRIEALQALLAGLPAQDRALVEKYRMNEGTLMPAMAARPCLRVSLAADPRRDWRGVRVPVLALNGALDHQVPPAENLAGIVGSLREGGNDKVESEMLPSLNHLLQTARTGAEDEYPLIDETMAPAAMEKVAAFVRRQ